MVNKLKCWKKKYSNKVATYYEGKGKRNGENVDIRDTGKQGILGQGYQFHKGFVVSINSKNWKGEERVVLPNRKIAESEVKNWLKKHDKC